MRGIAARCVLWEPQRRDDVPKLRNDMTDLSDSLQRMTFMQLVLLFGFLTAYVLALGAMLSSAGRRHAGVVAFGCAVGFTAFTDPWVHGALLMVFVVAGLGLFVVLAWLLARLSSPRQAQVSQWSAPTTLMVDTLPPVLSQSESPGVPTNGTVSAMR